MPFVQISARTTPTPPTTVKTCSHPMAVTSRPMSGANATVAKYCAELKSAEAKPRSPVGNQAATMRELPGKEGASAKPTTKRRTNISTIAASAKKPTAPAPW